MSEEYVLECTKNDSDCGGGYPSIAMSLATKGLPNMTTYPYKAARMENGLPRTSNICSASPKNTLSPQPKVKSYYNISNANLKSLLVNSPVLASVDASDWSDYNSGVFSCSGTPSLDHAVEIIGYDSNGNYIIKNSWGTSWGQNGYITLSAVNDCGIRQYIYQYQFSWGWALKSGLIITLLLLLNL